MREHAEEAEEENGELNLVPYLDIVTNIIIFLLASVAVNVEFGNVNVTLPTISRGGGAAAEEIEKNPLNLSVLAGTSGFTIGASGGILPPIPKLPSGDYDYKALTAKLRELKDVPGNQQETKATFNADANIPYEVVVHTLDAMREDGNGKLLFPDVAFSAGIL
ncbi:MAG TPA: biopolymer transporter ExbD [Polyangia bacterium]